MQRRAWVALAIFLAGLALGIAGRSLPNPQVWNLLAGLLFATAIGLWLSLLPVWRTLAPDPMPGLFTKPRGNERWCVHCGQPTAKNGPCRACGISPASTRK